MIADDELLTLLHNHPEKGLKRLMDDYMGLVYTIVSSKLAGAYPREDIEECVSDILFEVYKHRDGIDLARGSLKAYLSVVAKRRAIDRFREFRTQADRTTSLDALDREPAGKPAADHEMKDALIDEIHALGEPDNEIFIRKYYLGQSTRIIAEALQLKENTVDKRVSRGLDKLREALGGVL